MTWPRVPVSVAGFGGDVLIALFLPCMIGSDADHLCSCRSFACIL